MKPDHKEYQIQYAIQMLKHQRIDYFVFGHRHIPLHRKLLNNSEFVNLGDWINYNTYAKFDGNLMTLEKY
jgi:UDP-2,3-diacylglucosamine hydrolase